MTSTTPTSSSIRVHTKYVAPPEPSLPALALQVTQLVGSYMVWVGATEESPENAQLATARGALTRDWACAMPPTSVGSRRAQQSDNSQPRRSPRRAQRQRCFVRPARTFRSRWLSGSVKPVSPPCVPNLCAHPDFLAARRFKKQVFLSVDLPPSFAALGDGPRLVLAVERAVVDVLKGLEAAP